MLLKTKGQKVSHWGLVSILLKPNELYFQNSLAMDIAEFKPHSRPVKEFLPPIRATIAHSRGTSLCPIRRERSTARRLFPPGVGSSQTSRWMRAHQSGSHASGRTSLPGTSHLAPNIPFDNIRLNDYSGFMTGKLQNEIKQGKPFESLQAEVYLNLMRTADALSRGVEDILKLAGLSQTQYNILRILKGAGDKGLCCREIGERMITRDPDVTRLLDRMERSGLVTRSRDSRDRRVITARITPAGLKLVKDLDAPLAEYNRKLLSHMEKDDLRKFVELLEIARET
jgi:DNA-binding MarR family transcriptional regulator